jgi:hypothetical protein
MEMVPDAIGELARSPEAKRNIVAFRRAYPHHGLVLGFGCMFPAGSPLYERLRVFHRREVEHLAVDERLAALKVVDPLRFMYRGACDCGLVCIRGKCKCLEKSGQTCTRECGCGPSCPKPGASL